RRGLVPLSGVERISRGLLARALPCELENRAEISPLVADFALEPEVFNVSARFGRGLARSPFKNSGFMRCRETWTRTSEAVYRGPRVFLGDVLEDVGAIPDSFYIPANQVTKWRAMKGAKSEPRTHSASGAVYRYTEGALPFPDPLDRPGRTILTS